MRVIALCIPLISSIAFAQPAPAPFEPAPAPPGPAPTYSAPPRQGYGPQYGYGYPPPPQPSITRDGFIVGFSLGAGGFSIGECQDCDEFAGFSGELHLGGMVSESIALMGDVFFVSDPSETGSVSQSTLALVAQWFIANRVWVKGGVGFGQITVGDREGRVIAESETGGALLFGVGVEVLHSGNFAIDLSARLAAIGYDGDSAGMGALLVGFNWY